MEERKELYCTDISLRLLHYSSDNWGSHGNAYRDVYDWKGAPFVPLCLAETISGVGTQTVYCRWIGTHASENRGK